MRIRNKLTIAFLFLAFIPMSFISYAIFNAARDNLEKEILSKLEVTTNLKVEKLEALFDNLQDDIAIAQGYYNLKTNIPLLTKFSKDRTNPDFIKARDMVDEQLPKWLSLKDELRDIMLVGVEGKIVYSANKKYLEQKLDKPLPDAGEDAFEKGKNKVFTGQIFRKPYGETGHEFGLLMAAPVFDLRKQFVGEVAFEIDIDPIYESLQNNVGLGDSGETLLVRKITNDRALYISPLKYDPKAVLARELTMGSNVAIPAQKAAMGESGSGIFLDYRGKKVVAMWRPIPLLGWGLVAKVDEEEAFLPVKRSGN